MLWWARVQSEPPECVDVAGRDLFAPAARFESAAFDAGPGDKLLRFGEGSFRA